MIKKTGKSTMKGQKNFPAPDKSRTHDPPRSEIVHSNHSATGALYGELFVI